MVEAVKTHDGWYCMHDFRKIDWAKWRTLTQEKRSHLISDFISFIDSLEKIAEEKTGSFYLFDVTGHKADLGFMLLRPELSDLNQIESQFNKLEIADYFIRVHSYISVIELSTYTGDSTDPKVMKHIQNRLYPQLPLNKYICFYPMNKKRDGDDNWYRLPMNERQQLMRDHGMIGRQYAGQIRQFITGSIGLDDHEWGVTLFSNDALQFKKIVYEMRFDEASSRYGDFPYFMVGVHLKKEAVPAFLSL
ncbi:hydrogen peroxide-dependent heme synthase [Brochothrix campestris]|uniref:Coproheme decarboxylase n=1 Tax=Brochothrix campestris FSL F6-1037 TaxID=1265861 RepID=W7CQI7_9LIST|nr:hydrogen peroxide-dependent heme synthase [Brochothrix campestris]EUJ38915.1 heme peroxidase [Brochothrix campestris FSL F6-1037]